MMVRIVEHYITLSCFFCLQARLEVQVSEWTISTMNLDQTVFL